MEDHPLVALLVGLIRPLGWLLGACITTRYKNWSACVGCLLFIYTSTVASFSAAGYDVPSWMGHSVTYVSTPGVIFMVGGMYLSFRTFHALGRQMNLLEQQAKMAIKEDQEGRS